MCAECGSASSPCIYSAALMVQVTHVHWFILTSTWILKSITVFHFGWVHLWWAQAQRSWQCFWMRFPLCTVEFLLVFVDAAMRWAAFTDAGFWKCSRSDWIMSIFNAVPSEELSLPATQYTDFQTFSVYADLFRVSAILMTRSSVDKWNAPNPFFTLKISLRNNILR